MKLLMVCALTCVVVSGCKRDNQRAATQTPQALVALRAVEILDRTPPSARIPGIDEKTTRSRVEQALRGAAWIKLGGKAGAKLRVEVASGLRRTREGAEEFAAIVTVRAAGVAKGQALEASTVAPLRGKDGKPLAKPSEQLRKRHVWRTLDHAIASWLLQAKLWVGAEAALVAALGATDPDKVLSAIEICALRKSKQTVPRLIGLLGHKDRRVADRSIGALVLIGDRRAVKPLTKLAKFRDSARVAQLIDGIGSLGGEDARAFLEFVADGHRNSTVRNMARQALARLKREARNE
jgi:hypothetical protein